MMEKIDHSELSNCNKKIYIFFWTLEFFFSTTAEYYALRIQQMSTLTDYWVHTKPYFDLDTPQPCRLLVSF